MSATADGARPMPLLALLRPRRGVAVVLLLYVLLRALAAQVGASHGLVTPEGHFDPLRATLLITTLALRLATLFVAVPLLVADVVRRLLERGAAAREDQSRSGGGGQPTQPARRQ